MDEDDLEFLDDAIFEDFKVFKALHGDDAEYEPWEAGEEAESSYSDVLNTKNNTQSAIAIAFEDSQKTQGASFDSQKSL